MTAVVTMKLKTSAKEKRILERYFRVYYSFYLQAMKLVQKQMRQLYQSSVWQENLSCLRQVMTAPNSENPEISAVFDYLCRENTKQHQLILTRLAGKPAQLAKEDKRFAAKIQQIKLLQEKTQVKLTDASAKTLLTWLKSLRFDYLNAYQLNSGTAVAKDANVRSLLAPLTKKFQQSHHMYTATIGNLVILNNIGPAIQAAFLKPTLDLPATKAFSDFTSLQCGPFCGGTLASTPFKIDFDKQCAVFYFPRRNDDKKRGLTGKEKHLLHFVKFDVYRQALVARNQAANQLYQQTGDKSV